MQQSVLEETIFGLFKQCGFFGYYMLHVSREKYAKKYKANGINFVPKYFMYNRPRTTF